MFSPIRRELINRFRTSALCNAIRIYRQIKYWLHCLSLHHLPWATCRNLQLRLCAIASPIAFSATDAGSPALRSQHTGFTTVFLQSAHLFATHSYAEAVRSAISAWQVIVPVLKSLQSLLHEVFCFRISAKFTFHLRYQYYTEHLEWLPEVVSHRLFLARW